MWLLLFLATDDSLLSGSAPWWLVIITGPVGLTVYAVYINWKKDKKIDDRDAEIKKLNEERRKDLVAGMVFREKQTERFLKNEIESRETTSRMVQAMTALAQNLEKTNADNQAIQQDLRDISKIATRIDLRLELETAGHTPGEHLTPPPPSRSRPARDTGTGDGDGGGDGNSERDDS